MKAYTTQARHGVELCNCPRIQTRHLKRDVYGSSRAYKSGAVDLGLSDIVMVCIVFTVSERDRFIWFIVEHFEGFGAVNLVAHLADMQSNPARM